MNARVFRFIGALAAAALFALTISPAFAQRMVAPGVTPTDGVPGVRFTFMAPGFKGMVPDEDAKNGTGERVSYWINLPDGRILSSEMIAGKGDEADKEQPFQAQANGYGEVTIRWTAPDNAVIGRYTMVMRGLSSDLEVRLPFTVHAKGWQTVVQTNVKPTAGPAGTSFQFIATGFDPAIDKKDQRGEQVAYWFNTPDGTTISSEKRTGTNDRGNDTKPLLHYADEDGVVNLVWSSPETLKPGIYSVVFHGLTSQHEVVMFFTIR